MLNQRPTDALAQLDTISPVSQGAGTVSTGWVSAANFYRFLAEIYVGVFGASATVDAKVQQAQDNSGTGAKDVTGKAITQMVAAGGNGKQALINLADTDLDVNGGFAFIRLSITVGVAATLVGGSLKGFGPKFAPPVDSGSNPAIQLGSANVTQIVG